MLLAIMMTTIVYNVGIQTLQPFATELKTFSSYDELRNFLTANMQQAQNFKDINFNVFPTGSNLAALAPQTKSAPDHSTTNVQVVGVDEGDIVKTDGQYLYVVSGSNVYIIEAYPADQAKILSKISINQTYRASLYVNGDKLFVLGISSTYYPVIRLPITTPFGLVYSPYEEKTFANVYNISNKTNPILTRTVSFNGTVVDSRMIGDYVYIAVNKMATTSTSNATSVEVSLPQIKVDNTSKIIQPTEVRYLSLPDVAYYFTTVIAVNVINDAQEPTYETLLTGATTSIYVSQTNMYLTVPNTNAWVTSMGASIERQETIICRAKLDTGKVVFEAQGNVPGYVLNQFSMDEYDGFFRVATTKGWGSEAINYLTVLNMNLNIVGKISNIAPGESIYSARFMGDRCYLVTFVKIDPFYVIDLSNPSEPEILGYLKMPGFSGYLHPYDENHIIGVGKNATATDEGSFAWYQGVQVSLFDVSNVSNPIRVANYPIGDRGSDTPVLQDHKAFLFNMSKNLLVIPVLVAQIDQTQYPDGVPPNIMGLPVWQGAYVFNVSLTNGFVLKGNVTHIENSTQLRNTNYYVNRALYVDDMLYTVSNMKVKINNLQDLSLVKTIDLN